MQKFWKTDNMVLYGFTRQRRVKEGYIRIVNQVEIEDYLIKNPGKTEAEIMYELYNFTRGGYESNKKYADCLRRALAAGRISRVRAKTSEGIRLIYFAVPKKVQK